MQARSTKSAADVYAERVGVCRDFAHLAVAFCRCMNIPARYCTGYLGDIGTPKPWGTMDFAGWMEVWLGDRWYTFDARNNTPRIGRVLIAHGRDASDVALASTFRPDLSKRINPPCVRRPPIRRRRSVSLGGNRYPRGKRSTGSA
jgi:transglutaminase-like putative cysteine protease